MLDLAFGYSAFKASMSFLAVVLIYIAFVYVLWFFKRREYKKLWGQNSTARNSILSLLAMSVFALYVDSMIGFSTVNRDFILPIMIYFWIGINLLIVLGTALYNKGKKFRSGIPEE